MNDNDQTSRLAQRPHDDVPAGLRPGLSASRARSLVMIALIGIACFAVLGPRGARADGPPIDVVFVLDNSGSMRQNDPTFLTRTAVIDFASALATDARSRERDGVAPIAVPRIAIVLFDGQARLVHPLTRIDPEDPAATLGAPLALLDFSGQRSDSPAGVERAIYELRENARPRARQAIVLLSDGKIDTGDAAGDLEASRWLREELARESLAEGIQIFGIAFTEAADYQLMQALALETRASYFRAFEADELTTVIGNVLARVSADASEAPEQLVAGSQSRPVESDSEVPRTPNVAAAPLLPAEREGPGLPGALPFAVLLLAGALLWQGRHRISGYARGGRDAARVDRAPPAHLLDLGGQIGEPGATIALRDGLTRIGRDPHNDIVIEDDTVSSEHAVIEVRDGRYWIEDCRSTNGTRLADRRLAPGEPAQLKGGDALRFAEVDLMFVLAGYLPGGATVYLSSTVQPPSSQPLAAGDFPSDPKAGSAALPMPDEPGPDPSARAQVQDASDASSDSASRLEPEHDPELARENDESQRPVSALPDPEARLYRKCLDFHLARVEEISPAFAGFVERAFGDEIRGAFSMAARDLLREAGATHGLAQKEYTLGGIRFLLNGISGEMETARAAFVETHGGFTRLLTEQLQSESFRRERCEILAVLTFGNGASPWVSLSIVPDEGREPRIDLLSYELLTPEERQEIEPSIDVAMSQSGLG